MAPSALKDLVESYQHRILALEIELRQGGREGMISPPTYKKRVQLLRELKELLARLSEEQAPNFEGLRPSAWLEDLPAPQHCAPEELQLCRRYLREAQRFIKALYYESNSVVKWVQKAVRGRPLGLLTTIDLSRLRNKLLAMDSKNHELMQNQKHWQTYVEAIVQASTLLGKQPPASTTRQALKTAFHQLDELNKQMSRLRLRIEKEEEQLHWMEHWLSFQESKFSPSAPLVFAPRPEPDFKPAHLTQAKDQKR